MRSRLCARANSTPTTFALGLRIVHWHETDHDNDVADGNWVGEKRTRVEPCNQLSAGYEIRDPMAESSPVSLSVEL